MNNQLVKQMFKTLPEVGSDLTVGFIGYKFALILTIIHDAHHIALAVVTTLACGAAWHYFKTIVIPWVNKKVFKLKDHENKG